MLHNIHEADDAHYSYNNISNNKFVHNSSDFNNITLNKNKPTDDKEPTANAGMPTLPENPGMKNPTTDEANSILDRSAKNFETDSTWDLFNLNDGIYSDDNKTQDFVKDAVWIKVAFLNEGDEIAVADDSLEGIEFSKIKKITILPPEQVYDLSIEGTHNFVANGIIAHNTYITGGLGAGLAETTAGNITATGRLSITSTTATSTFSTGGLTVGTSQFVVQQNSGNVGIGTTSPQALLTVGSSTPAYLPAGNKYNSLYVSGLFEIGGTGTSTIASNLYVMDTLRAAKSYVGDLYFANAFRFTESEPPDEEPRTLILKNQDGEDILTIDEDGNLRIAGSIPSSAASSQTSQASVFDGILSWLEDKVLTVKKLFVKEEICVGNTCVNEEQLKALLEKNQMTISEPMSTPTPEPTPLVPSEVEESPSESPSPSPSLIPELSPEPTPESASSTAPENLQEPETPQ